MRADVHMHTNFSHDSESSPEEMIQGAIDKGLEVITCPGGWKIFLIPKRTFRP